MDGTRIDRFAKIMAIGGSRRSLFKGAGASGLALGAASLARPRGIRAQDATPASDRGIASAMTADGLCGMLFEVAVRQGPSAGARLRGILKIGADATGAVTGTLMAADGTILPVVGQATGKAITLFFDGGTAGQLYGVGVINGDLATCAISDMGGPVVGPAAGDSGDWAMIKKRVPEGKVCLLGDPFCNPDIQPPDNGGGGVMGPPFGGTGTGTCSEGARASCKDTCMAANLSTDCAGYCAEALFCPA